MPVQLQFDPTYDQSPKPKWIDFRCEAFNLFTPTQVDIPNVNLIAVTFGGHLQSSKHAAPDAGRAQALLVEKNEL